MLYNTNYFYNKLNNHTNTYIHTYIKKIALAIKVKYVKTINLLQNQPKAHRVIANIIQIPTKFYYHMIRMICVSFAISFYLCFKFSKYIFLLSPIVLQNMALFNYISHITLISINKLFAKTIFGFLLLFLL